MKTSTNAPFVQTPVATQVDGAIPTQVLLLELLLIPKLKQLMLLSCPSFHQAKWVWQFLLVDW